MNADESPFALHTAVLLAISWAPSQGGSAKQDLVKAIARLCWVDYPDISLLGRALERLIGDIDYEGAAAPGITLLLGQALAPRRPVVGATNAFSLASSICGESVESTEVGKNHAELAHKLGLPTDPSGCAPQAFTKAVARRRLAPGEIENYFESARLILLLRSRGASLKTMASALRSWAMFCDATGAAHFPIMASQVSKFATTCRDPGTFRQYAAHLKAACDFAGHSTTWYESAEVKMSREGLKRAAFVFKGPRMALTGDLAARLGARVRSSHQQRFFCILSWVFMLRARSEASGLVRAASADELTNTFRPVSHPGVIGLLGDELVIRVRSRKNRIGGDVIARSCVCAGAKGVAAHVPADLCPVHALWTWVETNVNRGDPLFSEDIADSAQVWLKIALEARGVPNAERFTLHSLRRGAAQTLIQKGGDLATLLRAGGWRSSAFRTYMDLVGLENAIVSKSLHALLDLDAGDE